MADADRFVISEAGPSDPIRILALAPLPYLADGVRTFAQGGTVFYATLLPRLAHSGHHVTVLAEAPAATGRERRTGLDWTVPRLRVEWFAYEHRWSQLAPTTEQRRTSTERLTAFFARELRDAPPDVVLVGREVTTLCALDLCERHGLPSLVIAHGPTVAALATGRYPEPLHRELLDRLGRVDGIVAVAEHIASALRALGLTRVRTITNAVDASRFRPAPADPSLRRSLAIDPDAVVIGHVSVLRPWKRPLDLVDSAAIVLAAEPRCVYLIVGAGPCRAEMETRARALGIADRFRWAGEVSHDAVPRYLNLMDVIVHPSEREGFPLIYGEAQACGRALLASDIAPAREAIAPGETGALFRMGDVEDLATQTLALARSPALRRHLGTQARAAVAVDGMDAWTDAYGRALRDARAHRGDRS